MACVKPLADTDGVLQLSASIASSFRSKTLVSAVIYPNKHTGEVMITVKKSWQKLQENERSRSGHVF